MYNWIFILLESVQRELLLFSAIWLLIGAIDDFSVDAIWAGRWLYRRRVFYRDTPPMTANQLPKAGDDGLLAIFIPAWGEAAVIGAMLMNCTRSWSASTCNYRIYVGCYPNDRHSVAAVAAVARHNSRIRVVLVGHEGPTTKADCLNRL